MAFAMQLALGWTATVLLSLSSSEEMPFIPQIEYCVSFWAKNITCFWDLLPATHPPTTYTLQITEESGQCRGDFGRPSRCVARQGEHSCGVPVEDFFAFYKIQLIVENQRGRGQSLEKCVHGMAIVKLSPPTANLLLANESRCFQLGWSLLGDEVGSATEAQYEIQYRDVAERSWAQVNFTAAENGQALANICGVSPFTNYSVRVRAKYLLSPSLQSDGSPFWSNWSPVKYVRTLPAVPSRGPALWRKFGISGADGKRDIILMWKPLKPKEANGEILTYSLFSQQKGEPAIPQCLTRDLQCPLRLPLREGYTFSITARNVVGVSPVTKLMVLPSDGQEERAAPFPVLASPATDHGLVLRWSLPHFTTIRYVFEWGRLPRGRNEDTFWYYHSGNTDHMVITEAIMPGNLYSLKVFALVHNRVWACGSTSAYSKQIAPRRAPTLYPTRIWKAQVELHWETLPLEERGGVIRNYTLCYREEGKDEQAVVLDGSIHRYIIKDLATASSVRVYLTAATDGGRTRGPVLTLRTKGHEYGEAEVMVLALLISVLLLFIFFGSLAIIYKHHWLQKYLWPQIPDPGKSNIAHWMPVKMRPDFPPLSAEKWSQGYLPSAIGDIWKVCPPQEGERDSKTTLENQRLVEAPGAVWKINPLLASEDFSGQPGDLLPKELPSGNEVEYSKVVAVQKSSNPEQRSPRNSQHLPPPMHHGVWLQNLTYEALMEGRPLGRSFDPTGEFPLLVSLVPLEGDFDLAEGSQRTPVEKS